MVGAEVFSRILDFKDRTTCVLFGDGAGAVVLEASEYARHFGHRHACRWQVTSTFCACQAMCRAARCWATRLLNMDGQAVFKLAVGVLDEAARAVLAKAGKTAADIDWLIPHQANIRIMQSTARKLKLPMDKVVVTVDQHGNTSAASIPLALDTAVRSGQVKPGQTLMLEGVGGGFTWGAVLLNL